MIASTDYVGIATLIGSVCAGIASILGVILANHNKNQVNDVHAAVTTPPNTASIGQLAADAVDLGNDIKKAVNGKDTHA